MMLVTTDDASARINEMVDCSCTRTTYMSLGCPSTRVCVTLHMVHVMLALDHPSY